MRIKELSLKGFYGFDTEIGLTIQDLQHRNIFVGPNNSGKSTIFRFLHILKAAIDQKGFNLHSTVKANDSWWWQHDDSAPVEAEIILENINSKIFGTDEEVKKLIVDGECRIQVKICRKSQEDGLLIITPSLLDDGKWLPLVKISEADANKLEHFSKDGTYISSNGKDDCPFHMIASNLLRNWADSMHFFDPVRALDRQAGKRNMDDGSQLLSELQTQQLDESKSSTHYRFKRELIEHINGLLTPAGITKIREIEIKGDKHSPSMYLTPDVDGISPISLENMGTGVAELIILTSSLVNDSKLQKNYFIEEPEIHLHPGLLRRLLNNLNNFSNIQFFISSHSNVVLDTLDADSKLFHFSQLPTGGCSVCPCDEITNQQSLLDSLGVSGSTLLQTNCVIWVEGPTDRLYLRKWIGQIDPSIQEGCDYSFAFYGGKVLSHFSLEPDETNLDEFLSMTKISRFSAVMMDTDLKPSQNQSELRDTKKRILSEAKNDDLHRKALTTNGREIENDIPISIFRKACCALLKVQDQDLSELKLTGEDNYWDEVLVCFKSKPDFKHDWAKNKLKDKKSLALQVLEEYKEFKGSEAPKPPDYVCELVTFIKSSRVYDN